MQATDFGKLGYTGTVTNITKVLVTGATGFIGAHIVDQLLERGINVRGTTRTWRKAEQMKTARSKYQDQLEFVQIQDFSGHVDFSKAVEGVDAIVHTASPLTYDTTNNEKELILPAIAGVRAILSAAAATNKVQRIVLTSSFASIVDIKAKPGPEFTYTGAHWNPLTYAEAIAPETDAVTAYRGSKQFAELEAWNFVAAERRCFDLVTFCPPMTFGPVAHPVADAGQLNESNARLWDVAVGVQPLPQSRVPVWVDVRDLARAHVGALFKGEVGMKRYVPAAPEKFSYEVAARVLRERFEGAKGQVADVGDAKAPKGYGLDGEAVARDFGFEYRRFEDTVVDLFDGLEKMGMVPWKV